MAALFLFALLPLLPATAWAKPFQQVVVASAGEWRPRVEWRVGSDGKSGEVVVNGQIVIRIRTAQGAFVPSERARLAAERLQNAVALGLKPGDVLMDAQTDRMNPRLKAAGFIISTATPDDARGTDSSPGGLAQQWATQLKAALQVPGLTVTIPAQPFLVPLGENRIVNIGGGARGAITVLTGSGDNKTVNAAFDGASGNIVVTGIGKGRDTLTITRENVSVQIVVQALPYAGSFEKPRQITVTGTQTTAETIARHVAAVAMQSAKGLPGSVVRLQTDTLDVAMLRAGQRQTVDVPLQITGAEMLPVEKTMRVTVVNASLAPAKVGNLFYSNDPESLTGYGTLFVGRLDSSEATRLLYHHQSAMSRGIWFTVELINDTDARSVVQVVGGEAGPVRDTVWVGYRAAAMFLRDVQNDAGVLIEIPPHSRVGLTAVRMSPGLTISGLSHLRVVVGSAPLVRVAADIPGGDNSIPVALQAFPTTWTPADNGRLYTLSEHVYSEPVKRIAANYRVGERWQFINLGKKPLQSDAGNRSLDGNYGVFYDMEITLENPTQRNANVQMVFDPTAGLAGAVFLIDGKYAEVPQINTPAEAVLARYSLVPGQKRTVTVRTLPLAGSNYPATFVVRPQP